jgi:ABC-type proline/glycine betaine transport system permease subunit
LINTHTGLRLANILAVGIGTIAAYINAGGLGTLLFEGVVIANYQKIIAGSLAVSFLVLLINFGLRFLEKKRKPAPLIINNFLFYFVKKVLLPGMHHTHCAHDFHIG